MSKIDDDLPEATLNEVIAEKSESLWVINNASQLKRRGGAGVILMVVNNGAETISVYVPMTYVPYDLSKQAPKRVILDSQVFRSTVRSKTILLVLAEDAERYFAENSDAKVELDRANQETLTNTGFNDSEENEEEDSTVYTGSELRDRVAAKMQKRAQAEIVDAITSTASLQIVEAISRTDLNEQETYSLVRNYDRGNGLTKDDISYILENCKFDKVKSFALAKRR